jgi:predicted RNA binding protein YcfA (HicA-like mRNA interferase family)
MTKLPVVSGARCISALEYLGYRVAHIRGSHVRMQCANRNPVTVPLHNELDRGTLKAILRSTEISIDEFISLLKR